MEKIKITELMFKLGYKVCGGGKYLNQCYGKNARHMMLGDDDNLVFAECIYDTNSLNVYELNYLQGKDEKGQNIRYVWRHPDFKVAHRKEAALLRETPGYTELPHKQISLPGVLYSITKYMSI